MKNQKFELIDENSSPLFRIMSVYNVNGNNLAFTNNICAFHIGNGIVISVAHNLRTIDALPIMLSESFFQNELIAKINSYDIPLFEQHYPLFQDLNSRVFNANGNQPLADLLINKLNEAKIDRRYSKLYSENCCKPHLVATFRNHAFCNDAAINTHFAPNNSFVEPNINRSSFLIELQLLDAFINEDIAVYKIVNTHRDIIDKLPSIAIDFELHDTGTQDFYCLQTAPYDNLGRIINEARIEGILDNFSQENDSLGNTYTMDGIRYLIKGYFRFGSSGSPYLIYDHKEKQFKANAVQSQASYIQLSIDGKREGNLQYVNGIASPLSLVEAKLKSRINESATF